MTLTPRHGALTRAGLQLAYQIEGSGPPALVIGCARYDARAFPAALRERLQLIFMDQRSFAPEPLALGPEDLSIDALTEDVEALRAALGVERLIIVGHSGHAFLALSYAARYPERVAGALLVGSAPDNSDARRALSAASFARLASPERRARFEADMAALPALIAQDPERRFLHYMLCARAQSWFEPSYDAAWLWEGVPVHMDRIDHVWGVVFGEVDTPGLLRAISAPVLLIVGEQDYLCGPPLVWDEAREQAPRLEVEVFDRSGHTPQLEEPQRFVEAVTAWMERHQLC